MKKTILIFMLVLVVGLFFVAPVARAVDTDYLKQIATDLGLPKYDSFSAFLIDFITVLLSVIFIIAVLFAIISGYRMVTSGGNEETLEKARKSLTWAIGGMVVVLLAWLLVWVVATLLNKGP